MEKFKAKKSLGQHFLKNAAVAEKIVAAGNVKNGDMVLEVGPGTGILTKTLLGKGARVIAVEADALAIAILEETFEQEIANGRLALIHGDVRAVELKKLGFTYRGFKVIANIPYYISGALFRLILQSDTQPETLVFLVQKEVAKRIAKDKKESLLSLGVKAYGTPRYVATVSRGNFSPIPKVDSAILAVADISRNRFKNLDEEWFWKLLHAGFASRRKQLFGVLKNIAGEERLKEAFSALGFDEKVRGEDLTIDEWISLAKHTVASKK